MTDDDLGELSGMVVDGAGVVAVADSGRRVELHLLGDALAGDDCAITDTRTVDVDPYDAEDLARGPDGAVWVADTGDNARRRDTVAVIVVPADGEARLHRLSYPDGPHDAEALLVDPQGRPVVVTKQVGSAGVYRTAAPPDGVGPTPLELVGTIALPPSSTQGGPIGGLGSRTVTGAAASADGRVVALRSYTDAWLYPAPDGDPVAALLGTGAPVQVPLPGEPQGEAIAFTPAGDLVSGSETRDGEPGEIRVVVGAAGLAAAVPPPRGTAPAPAPTPDPAPDVVAEEDDGVPSPGLPAALGGAVVVGVLLAGIVAMSLPRRRR
ncbi:hypothetical protein [Pseudonocardia humida]|uniref:hypothetical protein n=1 Tax=Pseudonocardia humida TaxID=2800819 RepID=UPI00207CBBED|nr:hypothetical protein [Pseudonocardia humida]